MNQLKLIDDASNVLTKTRQQSAADTLVQTVLDGDINPIEAYVKVKAAAECLSLVLKDERLVDVTTDECMKFGKERPTYGGASVCATEAGVRYDFSVCGDALWKRLSEQKRQIEEQLKAREKFLRSLQGKTILVDEETGAAEEVYPPAKTSSTVIRVNFQK